MISNIHDFNFKNEVLHENGLVLVDFTAKWCQPCKMVHPILEKISNENSNVKITQIDIDDNPTCLKNYGIQNIPTILFFNNGRVVDRIVGFAPKNSIQETINRNL